MTSTGRPAVEQVLMLFIFVERPNPALLHRTGVAPGIAFMRTHDRGNGINTDAV